MCFDGAMPSFPILTTQRLSLRQFTQADAGDIQHLVSSKEVAAGTFLPHPYETGFAEQWLAERQTAYEQGIAISFAIVLASPQRLIGSISLDIVSPHQHARMGYWLGIAYWNQGYCTEAVKAVLQYGFTGRQLHRIYAPHFKGNEASGRVLQKVGMTYEGRMREHYVRFGQYVDLELYGMLRREFGLL